MSKGSQSIYRQGSSVGLPQEIAEYLKAWMMSPEHILHPYPTEQEKEEIMADTGIGLKQLTNWFVNNRRRYWKPHMKANAAPTLSTPKRHYSNLTTASHVTSPLAGRNRKRMNHDISKKSNMSDYDSSSSTTYTISSLPNVKKTIARMGQGHLNFSVKITDADDQSMEYVRKVSFIDSDSDPCVSPTSFTSSSHKSSDKFNDTSGSEYEFTSHHKNCSMQKNFEDYGQVVVTENSPQSISEFGDMSLISSGSSYEEDEERAYISNCNSSSRKKKIGSIFVNNHKSVMIKSSSWKDACLNAQKSYDGLLLPTLEEATILFGFFK